MTVQSLIMHINYITYKLISKHWHIRLWWPFTAGRSFAHSKTPYSLLAIWDQNKLIWFLSWRMQSNTPALQPADYGMQWSPSLQSPCNLAAATYFQWYPTFHLNESWTWTTAFVWMPDEKQTEQVACHS